MIFYVSRYSYSKVLGWSVTRAVKEFTKRRKWKVFIHSPRKERGMVWSGTPALRGGGFELLLDYSWI